MREQEFPLVFPHLVYLERRSFVFIGPPCPELLLTPLGVVELCCESLWGYMSPYGWRYRLYAENINTLHVLFGFHKCLGVCWVLGKLCSQFPTGPGKSCSPGSLRETTSDWRPAWSWILLPHPCGILQWSLWINWWFYFFLILVSFQA